MSLETTVPIVSVDDLAAALDHYQGALGFKRDWTWGEPATLAGLYRDRIELQLAQRGKLGPPGTSHVYLRGSGVDALFEELHAAGVEILEPIADRPYGLRDFAVLDPSGNRLDFGAPLGEAKVVAPPVESLKIFVPAQDFAVSKRFYQALGFRLDWEEGDVAQLTIGGTHFLLQNHYARAWAENFMMHIRVPDADAWAEHARTALPAAGFADTRIEGPRNESWGFRIAYVWDPSGVLLHFAEPLAACE
jgi:catechol 2,3-dioxygenase-like lactoylglutathione lyase family enzyme